MYKKGDIVLVSGHWPLNVEFAVNTRKTIDYYCSLNDYDFYYDELEPLEKEIHQLHYRRCDILKRASLRFPDAKWFVWLDTDVFANRMDLRIEETIDLSDRNILYHLFYEKPEKDYPHVWDFKYEIETKNKVNTGVKFVSQEAIKIEADIWDLRNDKMWKRFPYEQRVMVEKIIPENLDRIVIHQPYVLNCFQYFYPIQNALFVHLCGRSEIYRKNFIKSLLKNGLNDKALIKPKENKKIRNIEKVEKKTVKQVKHIIIAKINKHRSIRNNKR